MQRTSTTRQPIPTMKLPGIPTRFHGRVYRSRLEARYASLFERLGWAFEYEPIDLHGYVPDFMLSGIEPMLVEVKPFVPPFEGEDVAWCCHRIEDGGWLGDALVVGAQHRVEYVNACVPTLPVQLVDNDGLMNSAPSALRGVNSARVCIGRMRDGDGTWRDAYIGRDEHAWHITHDVECATLDARDFFALRLAWSEAGNDTQWKAPKVHVENPRNAADAHSPDEWEAYFKTLPGTSK